MVLTSMKTTFPKAVPKEIIYRDKKAFKRELKENLTRKSITWTFSADYVNIFSQSMNKKGGLFYDK